MIDAITVNPNVRGGSPCLKGTRFTVAQVFQEIADGDSLESLAEKMDLDLELLVKMFKDMAKAYDRQ